MEAASKDKTVLGEWTWEAGKPKHMNYGDGPAPEPEAFAAALNGFLT